MFFNCLIPYEYEWLHTECVRAARHFRRAAAEVQPRPTPPVWGGADAAPR